MYLSENKENTIFNCFKAPKTPIRSKLYIFFNTQKRGRIKSLNLVVQLQCCEAFFISILAYVLNF